MGKGSKRREGLGYETNWDVIFGNKYKNVDKVYTSEKHVQKSDEIKHINEDHDYKEEK